ncbi:unnamed protein product, partial [Mesorhabditis spiculigera]
MSVNEALRGYPQATDDLEEANEMIARLEKQLAGHREFQARALALEMEMVKVEQDSDSRFETLRERAEQSRRGWRRTVGEFKHKHGIDKLVAEEARAPLVKSALESYDRVLATLAELRTATADGPARRQLDEDLINIDAMKRRLVDPVPLAGSA